MPKAALQPQTGCVYNKDDYLVFIARGYNQMHLVIVTSLYSPTQCL
jgi:hypothetical protein